MSPAFRPLLWIVALSLITPASSPFQSLASTSAQSSEAETLSKMTEQYGLAIAAGNLEAIRELWNPQSSDLTPRLNAYQRFFTNARIEIVNLKVTRADVTGERATSHLTTDERHIDRSTGVVFTEHDPFHGVGRSLEWVKTNGVWKIERESSLQDELAGRLESATLQGERHELLEKEKALVTDALVKVLIDRGTGYRMAGDFDKASGTIQLAQTVAEKIDDQVGMAKAWLHLGWVKDAQDEQELVLPYKLRALALYEIAGNKLGEATALYSISHNYHGVGDYQKAFDCAHKSLRLAEEMNYRWTAALALTELAHIYTLQNNIQHELNCLEKALAIFQELGNKVQVSIARYSIVEAHRELGNYDQALEIYRDLLEQTGRRGDQMGGALIHLGMGRVYASQGKYAEAHEYFTKALQTAEAVNYTPTMIHALVNLSEVYLAGNKYAEALPLAEKAVSLLRQKADLWSLYCALTRAGYCHLGLNNPVEARKAFEEAIATVEELRMQAVGGVEERRRTFEQQLDAYHGMLQLMVKENQRQEALVFAERTKARTLLDVLQYGRTSVQKAMTTQEQEQERRLKTELTRLNTQLTRALQSDKPDAARITEFKSRLEKVRLTYEAFETSLYAAHPELKVHRGETPIINAGELAALVPDDTTALLEYVVTDNKIYLFAITKAVAKAEAAIQIHTLPIRRDVLGKQIEAFRAQLAGRDLGFRASGIKLYNLLIKPAEAAIRGKTNIVITPDDTIWDLPFQALLNSANRFLIEDAAIAYAPSLTVLREMNARRRNRSADDASTTLLALGNPLLGKETVKQVALRLRDEKLDPLPEAEEEVKALKRLYGVSRSKVYVGAEAREDRFKNEAGQATILHFAAHGMLNNSSPMYSHLALAQGDVNEDGLLEAWELTKLDLKADLAVLSACETARGRIGAGEGIIGLSWAMFIAGVPSLVVSQWKVESAGTRDLMVNFHRILITQPGAGKKPSRAEALRQAALKLMKNDQTSHPFYWAGFVLVGDGR